MPLPFEVPFEEVELDLDQHVDSVFSCLQSEFLNLPKGLDFIEYSVFEHGYEALKKATDGFRVLSTPCVQGAVYELPVSLIVLRTMLGMTPPEWAYIATERTDTPITQGAARAIERKIRAAPETPMTDDGRVVDTRIRALITAACMLLTEGAPKMRDDVLHRLDKADTTEGTSSLHHLANFGAPYAMLLYERYLGRPFAAHRDSVSELVGDVLGSIYRTCTH